MNGADQLTTADLLTSPLATEPRSPSDHTNIIRGFVPANVTVKSCLALLPDAGWWEANLWAGYDQVITQLSDFSVTFSQSPAERANHIIHSLSAQPQLCLPLSIYRC